MRVLKIILALFCVWSVVDFIVAVYAIHSPQNGAYSTSHEKLVMARCLVLAVAYGAALFGIHKKAPIAWKLGWGAIAAELLALPVWALSVTSRIPRTDSPGVAAAAVIVGGVAVALYWGFWWYRQKSYFVKPATHE
jgi:hypothetical protein